jgi:hypothetical protein
MRELAHEQNGGHFFSALHREWAEWPDDVIEGSRLGEKTVGRKSRFAGFDQHENLSTVGADGQTCGVENLCLQHYSQPEHGAWYGLHCEGACFRTLFGILFWDIIFCSQVPDVFLTPFQDAPLDLNTFPDFFVNRKNAILDKLEQLKVSSPQELLTAVALGWKKHYGTLCRGVNWTGWSLKFLQLVALCVGGEGLAGIGRTLCVNYRHFSGGLPDLVLLKASRRRKGPGASKTEMAAGPPLPPKEGGGVTEWDSVLSKDTRPSCGILLTGEGEGEGGDGAMVAGWEAVDLDALVGGGGIIARGLEAHDLEAEEEDRKGRKEKSGRWADASGRGGGGGRRARKLVRKDAKDKGAAGTVGFSSVDLQDLKIGEGEGGESGAGRPLDWEGGEEQSAGEVAGAAGKDAEALELAMSEYAYRFEVKLVEVKGPNDR